MKEKGKGSRPYRRTGEYIVCQNCGKVFYAPKNRVLKGIKYCSRKCKGVDSRVTKVCEFCGKEFWTPSHRNERYCSKECCENARRVRKTGEFVICEWCSKDVYKFRVHLDKHKHHFCSQECANLFQGRNKVRFICKICGKEFWWSKSRLKTENPMYCSTECRNKDTDWIQRACIYGNVIQQNKKGLNKIELEGRSILNGVGISFKEQVLIANKFLVDILIEDKNLIIQWDGDYWHGHPRYKKLDDRQKKRKRLDSSQDTYLRTCGFKVLRIWESDIKDNPEEVKKRIEEALML